LSFLRRQPPIFWAAGDNQEGTGNPSRVPRQSGGEGETLPGFPVNQEGKGEPFQGSPSMKTDHSRMTRLVLGIESSCDETAAAVLVDGRRVLSSVVASQDDVHAPYGGVVPELASRRHIEVIVPVVDKALSDAGVKLGDLHGIAVTQGPGLVGSLLVGCSMAKALAWVHDLPLVGVNHLEGHIYAAFLTDDPPEHPFLALVVSGGHTALYHAAAPLTYRLVGQTRDDAAGEAFDK